MLTPLLCGLKTRICHSSPTCDPLSPLVMPGRSPAATAQLEGTSVTVWGQERPESPRVHPRTDLAK